eukprot:Skav224839  [mRNA]  locus=scaffold3408:270361:275356:- [translate_table: standard]
MAGTIPGDARAGAGHPKLDPLRLILCQWQVEWDAFVLASASQGCWEHARGSDGTKDLLGICTRGRGEDLDAVRLSLCHKAGGKGQD